MEPPTLNLSCHRELPGSEGDGCCRSTIAGAFVVLIAVVGARCGTGSWVLEAEPVAVEPPILYPNHRAEPKHRWDLGVPSFEDESRNAAATWRHWETGDRGTTHPRP
jgi:hypothetical protein